MPATLFALVTWLCLVLLDRCLPGRAGHDGLPGPAGRLVLAARTLALFLLTGGAIAGVDGGDLLADLGRTAVAGATMLLLFDLTLRGLLRLFAAGRLPAALANANPAAALLVAGHVVATAILVTAPAGGRDLSDLGLGVATYVVMQATLQVLTWLFRRLTAYDDIGQALAGNVAAGLAHAGLQVALALVLARAVDGPWLGLGSSFAAYGIAVAEGLLVYPLRQFVLPLLLLRARPAWHGGPIDRAIAEERDVGMAALELATYVGAALLLRHVG